MIGNKYGKIVILCEPFTQKIVQKNGRVRYEKMIYGLCECGKSSRFDLNRVLSGNTKSCGCLLKKTSGDKNRTHGKCKTTEYSIWCKMKDRCYNDKIKDYKWYGAKGIKVCDRWMHSFENFIIDMGERPSLKHSIDRINSKGNYEKSNCRWATKQQQARNQGGVLKVIYQGKERLVIELCEEYNRVPSVVRNRLLNGWDIQSALFAPRFTRKRKLNQ